MQTAAKDTCASVTVSALSVEAAAWKTGHFQNRGWPHVWGLQWWYWLLSIIDCEDLDDNDDDWD